MTDLRSFTYTYSGSAESKSNPAADTDACGDAAALTDDQFLLGSGLPGAESLKQEDIKKLTDTGLSRQRAIKELLAPVINEAIRKRLLELSVEYSDALREGGDKLDKFGVTTDLPGQDKTPEDRKVTSEVFGEITAAQATQLGAARDVLVDSFASQEDLRKLFGMTDARDRDVFKREIAGKFTPKQQGIA